MKVFRISGRDVVVFPCLRGCIFASMKVFRISGRDFSAVGNTDRKGDAASMKVFRISGRDVRVQGLSGAGCSSSLNESLPHKRKRPTSHLRSAVYNAASMKVFRISGRDEDVWIARANVVEPQ